MTVFDLSQEIVAKWGRPVKVFTRVEKPGYFEPWHEKVYEGEWTLTSTPRDPTPREAYVILSDSVRKWQVEHPEDEVKYVEITRGSPQYMKIQFIHHGHSPIALSAILAAFAAVILAIAAVAVPILQIALVVIAIWAAYRIADYFIPKPVFRYVCPECVGVDFSTYGELVSHMESEHPGVPIPPKEDIMKEAQGLAYLLRIAALVGIGLVGAYAFFKWVLPTITRRK